MPYLLQTNIAQVSRSEQQLIHVIANGRKIPNSKVKQTWKSNVVVKEKTLN